MLMKPIKVIAEQMSKRGNLTDEEYLGDVEDNNDPLKLGRVKVRISIYEDIETEALPWAYPSLDMSGNSPSNIGLNIPEIGSQVRVEFPNNDKYAPFYKGAELNEFNKSTFFDDDYPNSYGYKDTKGNFVRVNKKAETIEMQHSSGTNTVIVQDGSFVTTLKDGSSLNFNSGGNFQITMGNPNIMINISGSSSGALDIVAGGGVSLTCNGLEVTCPQTNFSGGVSVGTGYSGMVTCGAFTMYITDGIVTSVQ